MRLKNRPRSEATGAATTCYTIFVNAIQMAQTHSRYRKASEAEPKIALLALRYSHNHKNNHLKLQ